MSILIRVACAACLVLPGMPAVEAQTAWPNQPIRVIVPFPVGGQLDVVVRSVTDKPSPVLCQPIVVENCTGADGNIDAEAVAHSAPDGYAWLATTAPSADLRHALEAMVASRPHDLLSPELPQVGMA